RLTLRSVVGVIFFFSSRRRHTRFSRDWSSDVCSSDLADRFAAHPVMSCWSLPALPRSTFLPTFCCNFGGHPCCRRWSPWHSTTRSEERRVGKEWRSRWSPYTQKKKQSSGYTRRTTRPA